MKVTTISIPAEVGTDLDRKYFEVEARKQLIAFCLTQKFPPETMAPMVSEYTSMFGDLERAKAEFEQNYLGAFPNKLRWTIVGGVEVRLEIDE